MPSNMLAAQLSTISGVGEKTLSTLGKHDISNIFDLLLHTPKSVVTQLESPGFLYMEAGRTYVVKGKVYATKITGVGASRRLEAVLQDQTGKLSAIFFGNAVNFASRIFKQDASVTLIGEAKEFMGRVQLVHPKIATSEQEQNDISHAPRYSQLGEVTPTIFKRIVDKVMQVIKKEGLLEHVDDNLLRAHDMSPLSDAVMKIHAPVNGENWDMRGDNPHFRRLAFEELVSFYVKLNQKRAPALKSLGKIIAPRPVDELCDNFLPFSLTNAQLRVCGEILDDMSQARAMTRLVQGDVGSGKTAVSAIAARHVVKNASLQVAYLAPTEILAEQIHQVYTQFFAGTARIALLTARTKGKARKELAEKIAHHDVDIVIGTHALLSDDISFPHLGLVIVDEQHRFGVKQRGELLESCRNEFVPHLLVMSATPIPRSLALTVYGDLDLSVIDERPPGRVPVHTQILLGPVLDVMTKVCERIVATNQKAFVVFPLVEESEMLDLENATKALQLLQKTFGEHAAMLLHGKMKADEKARALLAFRDSSLTFLVATTVIEVGIDIPDATCILIVHPERFGLAQLHQLRGRVGRKDLKSYCFLISDITNKFGTAYRRLNAMCTTDNGFKLAEVDLEIRGPGDMLGTKQSGLPTFLIFNHTDFANLVDPAKRYAKTLQQSTATTAHAHLFLDGEVHFS